MTTLYYAVGDVHGMHSLLVPLLEGIEKHADGRDYKIVFCGDYVDRGPDSFKVVETLIKLTKEGKAICTKGNHEDLMLKAIQPQVGWQNSDKIEALWIWLENGGKQTLESYHGPVIGDRYASQTWEETFDSIPDEHIEWLERLPTFYETETHYFVHAGIDANRPLAEQKEHTQLWIRHQWLIPLYDNLEKYVVHGHTPVDHDHWNDTKQATVPVIIGHRANLDTGACFGGALTAAFIEGPGKPTYLIQATHTGVWSHPVDKVRLY